jgi:hypothetical protein
MVRDQWMGLPRLIRLMIVRFGDGAAMGAVVGLGVIRFDLSGIGTLLQGADSAMLTGLFLFQGALLFGTLQMSVAIMTLGEVGRGG